MAEQGQNGEQSNGYTLNSEEEKYLEYKVVNQIVSRMEWFSRHMDPRRDINQECGFPSRPLSPQLLLDLYNEDPIAARVVEYLPEECWQVQPRVYSKEKSTEKEQFELDWDALGRRLRGTKSWYLQEEGSPIWEYFCRAHIEARKGKYGIILLGFNDKSPNGQPITDLSLPVGGVVRAERAAAGVTGTAAQYDIVETYDPLPESRPVKDKPAKPVKASDKLELNYIRVFPEALAQVTATEANPFSPRYGQPLRYNITMNDPRLQVGMLGTSSSTVTVHWTRVIHIPAEPVSSNECVGLGPLPQVINNIVSLQKIYGASGEGYWLSCFTGLSLETNPQLGGNVKVDERRTKEMLYEYYNRLSQRTLLLKGMHANQLTPQVVDPKPYVDAQLGAICIKEAVPLRVFMGSEQGKLAADQDTKNFEKRKRKHRRSYCNAYIIIPFVDRLIEFGVLAEPSNGWRCDWDDQDKLTPQEQASVASTIMQALSTYIQGGVEGAVPLHDALTRILGWSDEEAAATIESLKKIMEEEDEEAPPSALLQLPAGVTAMLEMFKLHQAGGLTEEMLKEMLMLTFQVDEKQAKELIADGLPEPEPPPEPTPGLVPPQNPQPGVPGKNGNGRPVKGKVPPILRNRKTRNSFCPTGPGGGVDPKCGKEGAKGGEIKVGAKVKYAAPESEAERKARFTVMELRGDRVVIKLVGSGLPIEPTEVVHKSHITVANRSR